MKTEQIVITDDISGEHGAETVTFAIDGVAYTIDLTEDNHARLTEALAPFIDNATRVGKYGTTPGFKPPLSTVRQHRPVSSGRNDPAYVGRVKNWAMQNGIHVASRGRVPKTVVDAYTQAGGR